MRNFAPRPALALFLSLCVWTAVSMPSHGQQSVATPLAFPAMTQVGVIDLERVEVLKGPQGTLYGENSTGGAINYIAARPTQSFDDHFHLVCIGVSKHHPRVPRTGLGHLLLDVICELRSSLCLDHGPLPF